MCLRGEVLAGGVDGPRKGEVCREWLLRWCKSRREAVASSMVVSCDGCFPWVVVAAIGRVIVGASAFVGWWSLVEKCAVWRGVPRGVRPGNPLCVDEFKSIVGDVGVEGR